VHGGCYVFATRFGGLQVPRRTGAIPVGTRALSSAGAPDLRPGLMNAALKGLASGNPNQVDFSYIY